jgi:hypothetical protein
MKWELNTTKLKGNMRVKLISKSTIINDSIRKEKK